MIRVCDIMDSYFFEPLDGQTETTPVHVRDLRIELVRVEQHGEELFDMRTELGFHDAPTELDVTVPGHQQLLSDLTSTPDLFTWLVPKTGRHLPAALLHDGLVCAPDQPTYHAARPVSRPEADRIFRDAMAVLGTGLPRRWLIWTAVTVATAWSGEMADGRSRGYWRAAVGFTITVIVALGALATVDLFRNADLLPWMAIGPWWSELLFGGLFAVLIPALLSLLWPGIRIAAVITGVALALLLHVTVVLAVLTVAFRFFDDRFH